MSIGVRVRGWFIGFEDRNNFGSFPSIREETEL
jgi:hypothetical protein